MGTDLTWGILDRVGHSSGRQDPHAPLTPFDVSLEPIEPLHDPLLFFHIYIHDRGFNLWEQAFLFALQ